MSGHEGLEAASKNSILNANYISHRLKDHFPTKYSRNGLVAHECILDCAEFAKVNIKEKDIAKRLMD